MLVLALGPHSLWRVKNLERMRKLSRRAGWVWGLNLPSLAPLEGLPGGPGESWGRGGPLRVLSHVLRRGSAARMPPRVGRLSPGLQTSRGQTLGARLGTSF